MSNAQVRNTGMVCEGNREDASCVCVCLELEQYVVICHCWMFQLVKTEQKKSGMNPPLESFPLQFLFLIWITLIYGNLKCCPWARYSSEDGNVGTKKLCWSWFLIFKTLELKTTCTNPIFRFLVECWFLSVSLRSAEYLVILLLILNSGAFDSNPAKRCCGFCSCNCWWKCV